MRKRIPIKISMLGRGQNHNHWKAADPTQLRRTKAVRHISPSHSCRRWDPAVHSGLTTRRGRGLTVAGTDHSGGNYAVSEAVSGLLRSVKLSRAAGLPWGCRATASRTGRSVSAPGLTAAGRPRTDRGGVRLRLHRGADHDTGCRRWVPAAAAGCRRPVPDARAARARQRRPCRGSGDSGSALAPGRPPSPVTLSCTARARPLSQTHASARAHARWPDFGPSLRPGGAKLLNGGLGYGGTRMGLSLRLGRDTLSDSDGTLSLTRM